MLVNAGYLYILLGIDFCYAVNYLFRLVPLGLLTCWMNHSCDDSSRVKYIGYVKF